jgi:hypothetical protein
MHRIDNSEYSRFYGSKVTSGDIVRNGDSSQKPTIRRSLEASQISKTDEAKRQIREPVLKDKQNLQRFIEAKNDTPSEMLKNNTVRLIAQYIWLLRTQMDPGQVRAMLSFFYSHIGGPLSNLPGFEKSETAMYLENVSEIGDILGFEPHILKKPVAKQKTDQCRSFFAKLDDGWDAELKVFQSETRSNNQTAVAANSPKARTVSYSSNYGRSRKRTRPATNNSKTTVVKKSVTGSKRKREGILKARSQPKHCLDWNTARKAVDNRETSFVSVDFTNLDNAGKFVLGKMPYNAKTEVIKIPLGAAETAFCNKGKSKLAIASLLN